METRIKESIIVRSLLKDKSNYDLPDECDWVKGACDEEDDEFPLSWKAYINEDVSSLANRGRQYQLPREAHRHHSHAKAIIECYQTYLSSSEPNIVLIGNPFSEIYVNKDEKLIGSHTKRFLVNKKIAQLVFNYIIDDERLHSIEPLAKSKIKELSHNENKQKIIGDFREEISEFVLNLIISFSSESELLGLDRKVIINSNNSIATDFGNEILNEYRAKPSDLGEFIKLLTDDIRQYAILDSFKGDWGSLKVDVYTNEVVILVPENHQATEHTSRVEVITTDILP